MRTILEFIAFYLINQKIDLIDMQLFNKTLPELGFSQKEVIGTLNWLKNTIVTKNSILIMTEPNNGIRIYTPEEIFWLDTKIRGMLFFMQQNQIISPATHEFLIDRALALKIHIKEKEFNWILLFCSFNREFREQIFNLVKQLNSKSTLDKLPTKQNHWT